MRLILTPTFILVVFFQEIFEALIIFPRRQLIWTQVCVNTAGILEHGDRSDILKHLYKKAFKGTHALNILRPIRFLKSTNTLEVPKYPTPFRFKMGVSLLKGKCPYFSLVTKHIYKEEKPLW